MKPPVAALVSTLLLHGVVIALVVRGLSGSPEKPRTRQPVVIQLSAPEPQATPQPQRQSPVAPPVPPETKPRQPKAPTPPKPAAPAAKAREPVVSENQLPDAAEPMRAQAMPGVPAAQSAAPVPQAAPVKTGVSIPATYAAGNRKPEYPALSRRFEEQGTVVVRVFVKADGTAGTVEIKSSSGFPLLDASAQRAVQTWRFNPATSDGKPIAEWYQVAIPFTLQN
jgi:protein TonB